MRDGRTVAMMADEDEGSRIFFTSTGRSLVDEDEIVVLSVGVDIGSSTSHLVFSRIVLERLDSRYVVTTREAFYQSDILLTPYSAENTIDGRPSRLARSRALVPTLSSSQRPPATKFTDSALRRITRPP